MMHVDITMADIRIVAMVHEAGGNWDAKIFDAITGKSLIVTLTNNEWATILALMVAGDDYPLNTKLMYALIDDALTKMPTEFRPVP